MSKRTILALTAGGALIAAGCGNQDVVTSSDNVVAGKQKFVQKCGSCHTLARAPTKGTPGPNPRAAVKHALKDGEQRSPVRGIVFDQILPPADLKDHSTGTQMPPKLV